MTSTELGQYLSRIMSSTTIVRLAKLQAELLATRNADRSAVDRLLRIVARRATILAERN